MVKNRPALYGIVGGIGGTYLAGLLGGLVGGGAGYYLGQRSERPETSYRHDQYLDETQRYRAHDAAMDEFSFDK